MHYHDPVVAVKFLTFTPVVRRYIMSSGHLESFAYVIHILIIISPYHRQSCDGETYIRISNDNVVISDRGAQEIVGETGRFHDNLRAAKIVIVLIFNDIDIL